MTANQRPVAAIKYTAGTQPPGGRAHIAIVEVQEGAEIPPRNMPVWNVTYYTASDPIPANLATYHAWAYALTSITNVPKFLRAVATWVATAIGTLYGTGGLDFSNTENSHHIVTTIL